MTTWARARVHFKFVAQWYVVPFLKTKTVFSILVHPINVHFRLKRSCKNVWSFYITTFCNLILSKCPIDVCLMLNCSCALYLLARGPYGRKPPFQYVTLIGSFVIYTSPNRFLSAIQKSPRRPVADYCLSFWMTKFYSTKGNGSSFVPEFLTEFIKYFFEILSTKFAILWKFIFYTRLNFNPWFIHRYNPRRSFYPFE